MLSAFAIRRARAGERVLVIDMDVDAPGAGMLLGPDEGSTERGIVDYLLEGAIGDVDIADDVHRNRRPQLVGDDGGEIIVLSAGTLNVGTNSIQSQLGLTQVLRNLGIQRLDRGDSQANCLVMHAMVVDNADVENIAREKFQEWLDETMERHYFIAEDQPEDDDWSV